MFKGITFGVYGLIALVLFMAGFCAWYAIASIPYFPRSLRSEIVNCPPAEFAYEGPIPVLDDFEQDWFAAELRGLRERPIFNDADAPEKVVRFTWMRSFDAPVMVRTVQGPNGEVRLIARRVPGLDGCPERARGCEVDRLLTPEERAVLAPLQARVAAGPGHECRGGLDGARWLVEFSGGGRYKVAQSFSPDTGPIHDLGIAMLGLTGWTFTSVY